MDGAIANSREGGSDRKFLCQLLDSVSRGETEALQAIYYLCRRSIFAVSYSIIRDYQLSEDIVQETMLRIWERAGRFKAGTQPRAWIHTIARNLTLDLMRKRKNTVSVEPDFDVPVPSMQADSGGLDEHLSLQAGLDCLPEGEAEVFVLRVMVGLSHTESARILGISYRTVRYRYSQALKRLRLYLDESERTVPFILEEQYGNE